MSSSNESVNIELFRSNYKLMMVESSLFWLACSFIDANIVVSVFIHEYTGSMQLAGLCAMLRTVAFLTAQFIGGFLLLSISNRAKFMRRIAVVTRCSVALMVPTLLLGVSGERAAWMLIVCLCMLYLGDGCIGLIWTGISARTIPNHMRGQMIGNAQIISGVLSLLAGFIIRTILGSELSPSVKYSLIFGLCGFSFLLNMLVLCRIKDDETTPYPVDERPNLKVYLGQFKRILCDLPRPRLVIMSRALYTFSLMAAPLTVLFGQSYLGLSKEAAASMVYIQIVGVLCGGFAWGRLSRFFSCSLVMIGSMSMAVVIGGLGVTAFLLGPGIAAKNILFFIVFCVGFNQSSWLGFSNEIIRLSKEKDRTTMLVMMALMQLPASLGPYLAGIMAEKISFLPVFSTVLGCGIVGVAITVALFRKRNAVLADQ